MFDLLTQAIRSATATASVEALLIEFPDLPVVAGKFRASGFHTEHIPPDIAGLLVERAATLSIHAAAGFGFTEELTRILRAEPAQIHSRGGDGCTALHFARKCGHRSLTPRIWRCP
jgi:hypothetical protein